jgi:hypothetical protein
VDIQTEKVIFHNRIIVISEENRIHRFDRFFVNGKIGFRVFLLDESRSN